MHKAQVARKQSVLPKEPLVTTKNTKVTKDELSNRVIGYALEIHRELGPGLLESTYEQCLAHEFKLNDIRLKLQQPQPVDDKDLSLDCGYRIDMFVENVVSLS